MEVSAPKCGGGGRRLNWRMKILWFALLMVSPAGAAVPLIPRVQTAWETAADAAPGTDVVELAKDGGFYRFQAVDEGGKPGTKVYFAEERQALDASTNLDALHWIATLPVAVVQVMRRGQEWFVTARRDGVAGLHTAALAWEPPPRTVARDKSLPGIRVALYDDYGSFGKGVPVVSAQLARAAGIEVVTFKPEFLHAGGLRDFDVVIFTGGSGSKQANKIGLTGREQVTRFVRSGGGYIGICAGNYLACEGFSWGVGVLDAKTKSSKWARGVGEVKIEFTPKGREILGMPAGQMDIRYANGPVFAPALDDSIGDFEPLALFRTELAKNGSPVGAMVNSAAMAAGDCGQGRVLVSSPHPEQTAGMENFIERAVRWAAGKGMTKPE